MLPWSLPFLLDTVFLKIILSCFLCGLIGLEREYRQKAAGFRTHLLVGLGSTLFTLLSMHGFGASDPSRVAAQIVSGIGFIGGGAILRHGLSVRGVTTAATLWLVAAIGMAVAVGWYEPGLVATAVALLTLIVLPNIEAFLPSLPTPMLVQLRLALPAVRHQALREYLEAEGWVVRRGTMQRTGSDELHLVYLIRRAAGTQTDLDGLIGHLQQIEGLREIGWEVLESPS